MAAANEWSTLPILTADTCQAGEWEIVIISLVKTCDLPGLIGTQSRASVVTTRAREDSTTLAIGQISGAGGRISGFRVMRRCISYFNTRFTILAM